MLTIDLECIFMTPPWFSPVYLHPVVDTFCAFEKLQPAFTTPVSVIWAHRPCSYLCQHWVTLQDRADLNPDKSAKTVFIELIVVQDG